MRSAIASIAAVAIFAGGCATDSATDGADGDEAATTTLPAATGGNFGSLVDICGDGDATVAESEAGLGTDKLYVGVTNDRTSDIRPGLNKELYDSSAAFVSWCNEQGGIAGLPIELLDIDAKLIDVEGAMATACTDSFALVGGGLAQDDLMLSGNDGTDFNKCGLVSIPAWSVSPLFSSQENVVTPIPNPPDKKSYAFFDALLKYRPEAMEKYVSVYGDLPAVKTASDASDATIDAMGGIELLAPISYDPLGNQDWSITAQQIVSSGATIAMYVGEPANLSYIAKQLSIQEWDGLLVSEANTYDQVVIDESGPEAIEGFVARTAIKPFNEPDEWPEIAQYLEILDRVPDAKLAVLGVQSFSAWLLFADSVKKCAEDSGGEVTRACVIETAKTNKDWTGGGLHASTDLSTSSPPACALAMEVVDGEFTRMFPELGSEDDDGNGMYCTDPAYVEVEI